MNVSHATEADVPSWLEIVREVEPLFGPMPNFDVTLRRKIGEKAAFCVRTDSQGDGACVLGGILLGGTRTQAWIRWLAVRSSSRGTGVGQCLVKDAIGRLAGAHRISLDTFREENIEGRGGTTSLRTTRLPARAAGGSRWSTASTLFLSAALNCGRAPPSRKSNPGSVIAERGKRIDLPP